jgi:hypothetical protein
MKAFIIAAALAGLATAAPLNAQSRTTSGRIVPTNRTNRQDCTYNQNGSTVSDIVFGRNGSSTNNCTNASGNRVDGQWYSVGRDRNGNTIYERRVRDGNGNIIVQRARQDTFGNMSIISSRNVGNDGRYNNNSRRRDNGSWNNNRRRRGDDDGDDDDRGDDDRRGSWNNGSYSRNSGDHDNGRGNSERHRKDRGKGHKGRD